MSYRHSFFEAFAPAVAPGVNLHDKDSSPAIHATQLSFLQADPLYEIKPIKIYKISDSDTAEGVAEHEFDHVKLATRKKPVNYKTKASLPPANL